MTLVKEKLALRIQPTFEDVVQKYITACIAFKDYHDNLYFNRKLNEIYTELKQNDFQNFSTGKASYTCICVLVAFCFLSV